MNEDELPTGDALDQLLGSDFPDEGSGTGTQTGAEARTGAEGDETSPPQTEQQTSAQNWNPDGPGDPAKALVEKNRELSERNELLRQYQEQMQQANAILSNPQALMEHMTRLQQLQQQQEQQRLRPVDLSRLDPVTDPDGAFSALVEVVNRQNQQIEELRNGISRTSHESQFALARESARQKYPDYDEVVQRLAPYESMLNPSEFLGPNGPEKAYQFAKTFINQEEVQRQVANGISEQARRVIPTPPKTPTTLGKLPVTAPNSDARGDIASLSHAQIEKVGVHEWYDRAIRGVS